MTAALDAHALLAYLGDEPGADDVLAILSGARTGREDVVISVVNLGEVLYTVEIHRGLEAAERVLAFVDASPVRLVDADRRTALAAARLKASLRIGYADCFAVATAREVGGTVVTGDPDFAGAEDLVPIRWIG